MKTDIETLLAKYSEGTLTRKEADELRRRLSSSPQDAEAFRHWREAETLGRVLFQLKHLDEERAWRRLQRRMTPSVRRPAGWMLVAAGLALLIGLGTWLYWKPLDYGQTDTASLAELFPNRTDTTAILTLSDGQEIALGKDNTLRLNDNGAALSQDGAGILAYSTDNQTTSTPVYHQIRVPAGGSYRLVLSDGTQVHLNAASSLRYPANFDGTRRVELDGEAYFEVRPGHTPFEVVTSRCRINVLGTIFNVEAYEGKNVVTTLVKGSVKIGNQGHDVLLKPGEQAQVESPTSRPEIRTVNTSLYTSWVTGVFHFKDTTLGDIAQLLSRWYDVDIRCAGTHVADIRLAGSIYRNRELGYTLELLQHVGRLTFRKQADGSILIQEKQSSNHN